MGNWCSGTVVLCSPVCVVGVLSAAAPQGCGWCVLMYMGTDQGGWALCGLWVWVVVTVLPRRAGVGVKC